MICLNNALSSSMDTKGTALYDIPYNFVIVNNADVYECRGWNAQPEPILLFPPDSYIFIGISKVAFEEGKLEFALNQLIHDGQMKKKVGNPYRFIECDKTCRENIFNLESDSLCEFITP